MLEKWKIGRKSKRDRVVKDLSIQAASCVGRLTILRRLLLRPFLEQGSCLWPHLGKLVSRRSLSKGTGRTADPDEQEDRYVNARCLSNITSNLQFATTQVG